MSSNGSGNEGGQGRQHSPIVAAPVHRVVANKESWNYSTQLGNLHDNNANQLPQSQNNGANPVIQSQSTPNQNNQVVDPANHDLGAAEDTSATLQPTIPSQQAGQTQKCNQFQYSNRELETPHMFWLHPSYLQDYINKFSENVSIHLIGKIKQCPNKKMVTSI